MAENLSNQSNQEVLEAEIARLSAEIQKYKELPEAQVMSEQEIVKKSIQSVVPPPPPPPTQQKQKDDALPDYVNSAPAESKLEVEYLVNVAFSRGIDKANAEAAKSNPFVMDAFHDALAAKLYPELQKRGIIK